MSNAIQQKRQLDVETFQSEESQMRALATIVYDKTGGISQCNSASEEKELAILLSYNDLFELVMRDQELRNHTRNRNGLESYSESFLQKVLGLESFRIAFASHINRKVTKTKFKRLLRSSIFARAQVDELKCKAKLQIMLPCGESIEADHDHDKVRTDTYAYIELLLFWLLDMLPFRDRDNARKWALNLSFHGSGDFSVDTHLEARSSVGEIRGTTYLRTEELQLFLDQCVNSIVPNLEDEDLNTPIREVNFNFRAFKYSVTRSIKAYKEKEALDLSAAIADGEISDYDSSEYMDYSSCDYDPSKDCGEYHPVHGYSDFISRMMGDTVEFWDGNEYVVAEHQYRGKSSWID